MSHQADVKAARKGVPGNSLASQALVQRVLLKTGIYVHKIEEAFQLLENHGVYVKALRFSLKDGADGDWMAVLTADTDDGPMVAFNTGATFGDCLSGLSARLDNGTLKWKEDEYASGNK